MSENLEYYLSEMVKEHNAKVNLKNESTKIISINSRKKDYCKSVGDNISDEGRYIMPTSPIGITLEPRNYEAKGLFEFAVKNAANYILKWHREDPKCIEQSHIQWANICFPCRHFQAFVRKEYMSQVKSEYKPYFHIGFQKYRFDFEAIMRDFPQFFHKEAIERDHSVTLERMIKALDTELYLLRKPINWQKYNIDEINEIDKTKHIHIIHLDLNDDDMPSFYEGIRIDVKIDGIYYHCEGLDYDINEATLYVSCQDKLPTTGGATLYLNTTFITEKIKTRIEKIKILGFANNQPIQKFIPDRTRELDDLLPEIKGSDELYNTLDHSQKLAHDCSIRKDISFIWGPPGTGKSFTLATLINTFYLNKETTLVCCISNVAVDQLVNKVIDTLEEISVTPQVGELLRAGHTTDSRVVATNYLFPNDENTQLIRDELTQINEKLHWISQQKNADLYKHEELKLKQRRIDLRERLKIHTETLIQDSTIIFSTIAYYILSKKLEDKKFDNLIIDEASMLSLPYLFGAARNTFKRIILVGDPNQLGPIAACKEDCLNQNVFDYCHVFENHPALHRLIVQRRSHEFIVNLINAEFYQNKLKAVNKKSPDWVYEGPFGGYVIKYVRAGMGKDDFKPIGHSRKNYGTLKSVMAILEAYHNYIKKCGQSFSIGIITPYRAQVKAYYAELHKRYPLGNFWKEVKVGTVHTFQGSECDLIIYDMVDNSIDPMNSAILNHKGGERLITVALSRARHKLIVVGDKERFGNCSNLINISSKVCRTISKIKDITAYPK